MEWGSLIAGLVWMAAFFVLGKFVLKWPEGDDR